MKFNTIAIGTISLALLIPSLTLANTHGKSAEAHARVAAHVSSTSCAKVPPGHLIAFGWLKHNATTTQSVPSCQTLPHGIVSLLGLHFGSHDRGNDKDDHATSTPDTKAPTIFSVATSALGSTTATISWQTNEVATSKVYFGTTTPLNLATATNASTSTLSQAHSITLSGLTASTTYYYVAQSADASGNTATTSQGSFITTQ